MDYQERVDCYNSLYHKYPKLIYDKGWIVGCFNIGNDYRSKNKFYGEFPRGYLARMMSMFGDKKNILHIFSGSLEPGNYKRMDVSDRFSPDVVGNAEEASKYFKPNSFDLVIADPPYQPEDSKIYGVKHPNKRVVMSECAKITERGGHLIWLDERMPMYKKTDWKRVGEILLTRSTNHRVRATFIFERV